MIFNLLKTYSNSQSVPSGMVFAFVYEVLKSHQFLDESNQGSLFPKALAITSSFASFAGILVSFIYIIPSKRLVHVLYDDDLVNDLKTEIRNVNMFITGVCKPLEYVKSLETANG